MQCQRVHRDKTIRTAKRYIVFIAGTIDGECYIASAYICEDCYRSIRPYIVIYKEHLIIKPDAEFVCSLSPDDMCRILARHGLPPCLDDWKIITIYEMSNKSKVLGIFVAGAYRWLYLHDELMTTIDHTIRDDEWMKMRCSSIAAFAGLSPVV